MAEGVIRITKDFTRANELYIMAQERKNDIIPILPKDKPYKIIEEYYEVIVQLSTAIMYANGYKTLSHISLIDYISKNYKEISQTQIELIDKLRKFRHGTVYYGKKISEEFLVNSESDVINVISALENITKNILKKGLKK